MPTDDFCYLTTTGRRTGRPHRIEIWYARDGDRLYLLSGGRTSDWVRNLLANPAVLVEVDGRVRAARAWTLADGTDEAEHARTIVYEKYAPRSGDDLTGWRRRALPVAIDILGD